MPEVCPGHGVPLREGMALPQISLLYPLSYAKGAPDKQVSGWTSFSLRTRRCALHGAPNDVPAPDILHGKPPPFGGGGYASYTGQSPQE